MARTTYDLDEELVESAREMSGLPTKKAAIEEALREFVGARLRERLKALAGSGVVDMTPEELTELRHRG